MQSLCALSVKPRLPRDAPNNTVPWSLVLGETNAFLTAFTIMHIMIIVPPPLELAVQLAMLPAEQQHLEPVETSVSS
jgi:hypothetical protein